MQDNTLTAVQKQRLLWVRLFEGSGNAGFVCRRCGISRPTLRKWVRRYVALGAAGLLSQSRRPHSCPRRRIHAREEQLILTLRRERRLGIKRLRNERIRQHQLRFSLATIHKVLVRHQQSRFERRRWRRKAPTRYSRPVPGDRVQIDVCKIAPGLYHYAAVDDCTRYRVLGLYPRASATHTLQFLDRVVEEMPFAIQRIQTDRGREFFALRVQEWLRDAAIKFRPIRPASPHLNGKVERAHKTDLAEFYDVVDLRAKDLHDQLSLWQHAYNWDRPHSSLGGKAPIDRVCELIDQTPLAEDVGARFDAADEHFRHPEFAVDQALLRLKRSL